MSENGIVREQETLITTIDLSLSAAAFVWTQQHPASTEYLMHCKFVLSSGDQIQSNTLFLAPHTSTQKNNIFYILNVGECSYIL